MKQFKVLPSRFSSLGRLNRLKRLWLIIGLFIAVTLLEFVTPPEYVFGYFYIAPILLADIWLTETARWRFTLAACVLTIASTFVPGLHAVRASTIISRFIAMLTQIVTGFIGKIYRLYQEKLLQQRVQKTQQALISVREDFASTLSNDLKTPLLGAIETLQAFEQGYFGAVCPSQKQVLATMIRSHQSSLEMVETLLDVYRNDVEGLQLHRESVDLIKIAENAAMNLTKLASSRRVSISFNYGDSNFRQYLRVNGDAMLLSRVFANLLTNAINHSPRGSKVEMLLSSGSEYNTVKVIDCGASVTPEELPNLFERFYQGYSIRQAKGSGLSLYLTRQIVEAHGGKIWVENRVSQGAVFAFRLPAL